MVVVRTGDEDGKNLEGISDTTVNVSVVDEVNDEVVAVGRYTVIFLLVVRNRN